MSHDSNKYTGADMHDAFVIGVSWMVAAAKENGERFMPFLIESWKTPELWRAFMTEAEVFYIEWLTNRESGVEPTEQDTVKVLGKVYRNGNDSIYIKRMTRDQFTKHIEGADDDE